MTARTRWQLIALAIGASLIAACLACYWLTQNRWFLLAGVLGTTLGLGMAVATIDWFFDLKNASQALRGDRLSRERMTMTKLPDEKMSPKIDRSAFAYEHRHRVDRQPLLWAPGLAAGGPGLSPQTWRHAGSP